VLHRYNLDRKSDHPRLHLAGFTRVLHADSYNGFDGLHDSGPVVEAACWAHVRRKFFGVHANGTSPLASEALTRIQALYAIEVAVRGRPPDERRHMRQSRAGPLLAQMRFGLDTALRRLSGRGDRLCSPVG
jgi:hypothetical protein